jgi:DNA-binding response OmpR family regulator
VTANLLYIEDDPSNIALLRRLIQHRPHVHLTIAMTVADGITATLTEPPDLILLDNRLPDGTGTDVLRQITTNTLTATIPVVILSGDTGRSTTIELLALGATQLIHKPIDVHELLTIIDHHIPVRGG